MIPGTVLFNEKFRFSDGEIGKKLLIILNEGKNDTYIAVKTTSKSLLILNKVEPTTSP